MVEAEAIKDGGFCLSAILLLKTGKPIFVVSRSANNLFSYDIKPVKACIFRHPKKGSFNRICCLRIATKTEYIA